MRVLGEDEDGIVHGDAAFTVWRFRNKDVDTFVRRYELKLERSGERLLLRGKRITLDAWTLAPYGAISIVLWSPPGGVRPEPAGGDEFSAVCRSVPHTYP